MTRRNYTALLTAALLVSFTYGSHARATEPWALTWNAPQGCPSGEEVLDRVRDIVGDNPARTAHLEASGRISKIESGFLLELRIQREDGELERSLEAKACEDLLGASAVVLGLHLRQVASDEHADGGGASSATNLTQDASSTDSDPQEKTPTPPTEEPRGSDDAALRNKENAGRGTRYLWLTLPQVGLAIGSLPKSSWLWGAGVGLRLEDWGLWLMGRYQEPQTVRERTVPNVVAAIDRYSAELGVSHGWTSAYGQIAPGVFAGVDHLVARGGGSALNASRSAETFPFVGAGVTFRWFATDWLGFAANICGEVPLSRPQFVVDSLGELDRINPVHLRLGLGSEWNL